ncbi:chemotaxis protein CheW [Nitrincola sp. MINF-07-Sa-05]|uniref:chemotaxis protein CheW n=1 Tax=Nitrincola salilacus TaxID=3400273 RepID=UPI003917C2D8
MTQYMDSQTEPDEDQMQQCLVERARLLARPDVEPDNSLQLALFHFELAQEIYAVEAQFVIEVLPLRQLTSIPGTPDHLPGVVSVRGRIVSVLDLRCLFEMPRRGLTDLNRIAVLSNGTMEFALLTDRTVGFCTIPEQALQAGPSHLKGIRKEYLLGVTQEHWAVLDGRKLLGDPHLVVESYV